MLDKLNTIVLGSEKYPIKCDNLVLEQLQDEFGTLDDYEKKLNGWIPIMENGSQKLDEKGQGLFRVGEPSMRAINFSLPLMIYEGIEIHNETNEEKIETPTEKHILRLVESPLETAKDIYQEYLNCFKLKNKKPTQNRTRRAPAKEKTEK